MRQARPLDKVVPQPWQPMNEGRLRRPRAGCRFPRRGAHIRLHLAWTSHGRASPKLEHDPAASLYGGGRPVQEASNMSRSWRRLYLKNHHSLAVVLMKEAA